jgi:hypothetical protein
MRAALVVVALAAIAGAQTTSSSNTTGFTDTLQNASDVVVADIISGAGVDDGTQVTVHATIRVVRVLSGGLAPGAELPITWRYKPTFESPAVTSKVALERRLFFLKNREALRAGLGFHVPAGAAPRYYPAAAPLQYKIACEVAPLIEEILSHHSADLVVPSPMRIPPPGSPEVATRLRYYDLTMTVQALDSAATKEIYADFSTRPEPYLKAFGIAGRLGNRDASALFDLEKDVAVVAPIFDSGVVPLFVPGLDLPNDLPAARALARLAVGETAVSGVESGAPMNLAWTHQAEFLPYFVVMLGSPSPLTRGMTLTALCPLLKGGPLWNPEMTDHCPNRAGSAPGPNEQSDIRYWTAWWQERRAEFPEVRPPARYAIPQKAPQMVEVPVEIRFLSLLHFSVDTQLTESDRAIWTDVKAAVQSKLDANDKRAEQMRNAARIASKLPDLATMKSLSDDRTAAAKSGLEELHRRLSPAGWLLIQKLLGDLAGGVGTTPR